MGTFHRHDFYTVQTVYSTLTPKLTHHRKLSALLHIKKTDL